MNTIPAAILPWLDAAMALKSDEFRLPVPLHILLKEAVDVSKFFRMRWLNQKNAAGEITLFGLESAGGQRLPASTGEEILSLQQAADAAQTAYLFTVSPRSNGSNLIDRGRFILSELGTTLEWYLDDGVEDEEDVRLAQVKQATRDGVGTIAGLASALVILSELARKHRDALHGLGGFDAALIDEAPVVAAQLRDLPSSPAVLSPEAQQALSLRNRLLILLYERMQLVRAAARFVFRGHPRIIREATSAYERKRRAAQRAAKAKQAASNTPQKATQSPPAACPAEKKA